MTLRPWRMRTTLMVSLLLVSLGLTALSLLIVRLSVQRQIRAGLDSDLQHSLATFRNLAAQKNEMLAREAALLADLPSLKALMATGDKATIRDASEEFWQLSGSDFFALSSPGGKLYTQQTRSEPLDEAAVTAQADSCLRRSPAPCMLFSNGRLYVLTAQPLFFGPPQRGSELGFVVIGYAVNAQVAREVSEAAAAEVAFLVGDETAASTLGVALPTSARDEVTPRGATQRQFDVESETGHPPAIQRLRLGHEDYFSVAYSLGVTRGLPVRIVVLKSYDRASEYLRQLNRWMAALGLLAVLLGGLLALAIARTVTRPLERLVEGTRALGQGDFHFSLGASGATELQELASAFEQMRLELKSKQVQLIESDRLATIGRMASSVSHDLRHHLSAIYANAEFMSLARTGKEERVELLREVQDAVQNMTDLIESLLLFSRTGESLHRSFQPILPFVERTVQAMRMHPEAREVLLTVERVPAVSEALQVGEESASSSEAARYVWIDARSLGRALFNLLLNACQAARPAGVCPRVRVLVEERRDEVAISVEDNGLGVLARIRDTMFKPFVSAGKENGTGLGLTLAQHIAQEHGGEVRLDETQVGMTRLTILLRRSAWQDLAFVLSPQLEAGSPAMRNDATLMSRYDSTGDGDLP